MKTLLAVLLFAAFAVHAAPVAVLDEGDIKITLYEEPCELKKLVTNLPLKAEWKENGKVSKGCYGGSEISMMAGLAMFYFDDKTVAVIPIQKFIKVKGI